jgi:hypothetical protein
MRHHASKRALSYATVPELTIAGARRLVGGLDDLRPDEIPRLQHPSTDTRQDQLVHVICRRYVYEEVCPHDYPVLLSQDEASKRKQAYTILVLIGSTVNGCDV